MQYNRAMRIVSLLPSATEIIHQLGLGAQLVGVTHECDYPPSAAALPKVTRTLIPKDADSKTIDALVRERLRDARALYSLDLETLANVRPDLIVTQALCDVCAVAADEVYSAARTLPQPAKVINLEPMRLSEVFDSMLMVGDAAGIDAHAKQTVDALRARVQTVQARSATLADDARPTVAFLEWIDPPFCAGHWTPELIELAGGNAVACNKHLPSTQIDWRDIVRAAPAVLFIAQCGFDIARSRQDLPTLYNAPHWRDLPCVRNGRVYLADGNAYFSRSGPRLVDSLELLAHALHPQLHPPGNARAVTV